MIYFLGWDPPLGICTASPPGEVVLFTKMVRIDV